MSGSHLHVLISKALREYPGLGRIELPGAPASGGFSGAHVVPVEAEAGRFALRVWPEPFDRPRVLALHRLLASLAQKGLPTVAVPRASMTGDTLVCIEGAWCQLEPWLPGEATYHAAPSREKLFSAIDALADWHLAAARYQAPVSERRWFETLPVAPLPVVRERLDRFAQLDADRLAEGSRQQARQWAHSGDANLGELLIRLSDGIRRHGAAAQRALQNWSEVRGPVQPCLRDIWHDHVLFVGQEVRGLLDPAAARTDSVTTDLARLLGSLVEDHPTDWELALNRYAERNRLGPRDRSLVFLLDRCGLVLSAAHWLERLTGSTGADPAIDLARVTARVSRLARRLESASETRNSLIEIAFPERT